MTQSSRPEFARVVRSDGRSFEADILQVFDDGILIALKSPRVLEYEDHVDVTFPVGGSRGVHMRGRVVTLVQGKTARIEAISRDRPVDRETIQAELRAAATVPAERPKLAGITVLVIEDDQLLCRALRRMLEKMGATVHATEDPTVALEILENERLDAILLDWILPEISGSVMLEHIRSSRRRIPVAIISGAVFLDGVEEIMRQRGASSVMHKPLDYAALGRWIQSVAGPITS